MPDASMPHSSGPEVGERPAEGRAVCERCRRPKDNIPYAGPLDVPPPLDVCNRTWPDSRAECDRLLLAERDALAERVRALEAELAALRYDAEVEVAANGLLNEDVHAVARERDALAEAGDRLAAVVRLFFDGTCGPAECGHAVAAWSAARSPKGAGNGD